LTVDRVQQRKLRRDKAGTSGKGERRKERAIILKIGSATSRLRESNAKPCVTGVLGTKGLGIAWGLSLSLSFSIYRPSQIKTEKYFK
jgi:hypothetical protein